jgi:hypothetical protein
MVAGGYVPEGLMQMRYKIKTSDEQQFRDVRRLVQSVTAIQLESPKRRTIAVDNLPKATIAEVEALGGKVSPDIQYDLDNDDV